VTDRDTKKDDYQQRIERMSNKLSVDAHLAQFPVLMSIAVQWGDQDAFGHVNNTIYLRWFESARIAYFERMGIMDLHEKENVGPILASVTCNYRRPVTYPDSVTVGARVTRIGRTSFEMDHVCTSEAQGLIVAEGKTTLVVYDYHREKPHPISETLRTAIGSLEGRSFE
jgi:acyl-CoA thioester hydrolase